MNDIALTEHHAASNVGLPIPINDGNGEESGGSEFSRSAASSNKNEGALSTGSARPEQRAPTLSASVGAGSRKRLIGSISIDEDGHDIGSNGQERWFGAAGKFLRFALGKYSHAQPTNQHPPNHLHHSLTNGNELNSNGQENQNVRVAVPMQASSRVPRKKQQRTVHRNWRADRRRKTRPPARPPLADLSNNNEHNHEDVQFEEGIEEKLAILHHFKKQYDAACCIQRFARGIAANDEAEEEVPQEDDADVDDAEGIPEESEEEANNDTIGLQLSSLSSPPSSHHDSPVTTGGLHQPSTSLQVQAMQQDGVVVMPNDDATVPEMETCEDDADEGGAKGGIELDEAMLQMDDEEDATSAVTTHTQQKDVDLSVDCVVPCTNEDDTLVDDVVDEDTSGDGNEESNTGTIGDDAVLPHEVVNQFDTEHDEEEILDATTAAIPQSAHECEDSSNLPTTSSSFCSVCRGIIIYESGCQNCLDVESATKLDDNTAASHQEYEDTMDISNNTTSEATTWDDASNYPYTSRNKPAPQQYIKGSFISQKYNGKQWRKTPPWGSSSASALNLVIYDVARSSTVLSDGTVEWSRPILSISLADWTEGMQNDLDVIPQINGSEDHVQRDDMKGGSVQSALNAIAAKLLQQPAKAWKDCKREVLDFAADALLKIAREELDEFPWFGIAALGSEFDFPPAEEFHEANDKLLRQLKNGKKKHDTRDILYGLCPPLFMFAQSVSHHGHRRPPSNITQCKTGCRRMLCALYVFQAWFHGLLLDEDFVHTRLIDRFKNRKEPGATLTEFQECVDAELANIPGLEDLTHANLPTMRAIDDSTWNNEEDKNNKQRKDALGRVTLEFLTLMKPPGDGKKRGQCSHANCNRISLDYPSNFQWDHFKGKREGGKTADPSILAALPSDRIINEMRKDGGGGWVDVCGHHHDKANKTRKFKADISKWIKFVPRPVQERGDGKNFLEELLSNKYLCYQLALLYTDQFVYGWNGQSNKSGNFDTLRVVVHAYTGCLADDYILPTASQWNQGLVDRNKNFIQLFKYIIQDVSGTCAAATAAGNKDAEGKSREEWNEDDYACKDFDIKNLAVLERQGVEGDHTKATSKRKKVSEAKNLLEMMDEVCHAPSHCYNCHKCRTKNQDLSSANRDYTTC